MARSDSPPFEPAAVSPREPQGGSGLAPHKLQRVLTVIEANLGTTMHVRRLAEAVALSPFHFARMFKKSTGQSPHAYITTRRMELAKKLLADPAISLSDVGGRVGFRTQAHFTDAFRRHVGTTPGRFRRQRLDEPALRPPPAAAAAPETANASALYELR